MSRPVVPWAFLGLLTGPGKLMVVVVVGLMLFGRVGVLRHLAPRSLRPFLGAIPWERWIPRVGPRGRLALKVLAWVALAAWVATRMTRIGSPPT